MILFFGRSFEMTSQYLNRVQLNADKCKELRISFAKEQRVFNPIIIEGKEVELVTSTKLLLRVLRPYNSERSNMERPCN